MRKTLLLLLVVSVCCAVLLASGPIQAQSPQDTYSLSWSVIGGAGAIGMAGTGHTVHATIGQTAIGWSENGVGLGTGFWYGILKAALGLSYHSYLPIVIRN